MFLKYFVVIPTAVLQLALAFVNADSVFGFLFGPYFVAALGWTVAAMNMKTDWLADNPDAV